MQADAKDRFMECKAAYQALTDGARRGANPTSEQNSTACPWPAKARLNVKIDTDSSLLAPKQHPWSFEFYTDPYGLRIAWSSHPKSEQHGMQGGWRWDDPLGRAGTSGRAQQDEPFYGLGDFFRDIDRDLQAGPILCSASRSQT